MDDSRLISAEYTAVDSEALFRELLTAVPDAVLVVDSVGRFMLANPAAEQLFGYSQEELIGEVVEVLLPERLREDHVPKREGRRSGRHSMTDRPDLMGRHRDGTELPVSISLGDVSFAGRALVLAIVRDLRGERSAREARRELTKLRDINQELEQFAYVASHDLRSPLRAISSLVGWIGEGIADGEDVQEYLDLLKGRTERLSRMLDDLLLYARIGRDGVPAAVVELDALVDDIVDLIDIPEGFRVIRETPLPSLTTGELSLRHALQNLLTNAVRHNPRPAEGGVWLSARKEDRHWVIAVRDDGPGIPAEHRERAFRPFETLKRRDEQEGTGLGLAIVAKAIKSVGGAVVLSDAEPHGCLFELSIPEEPNEP